MKVLNQVKKLSLATMLFGLVAGILFIAFPGKCIDYISYIVGAAFIFAAVVGLIAYLIDKSSVFTLGMGIVLGVIGVIVCVFHNQLISFIVIMIGIFVLMSGLTNLFTAFKMFSRNKGLGWATFILAVVTLVFSGFAITHSTELTEAIVRIIGVGLIVYAVVDLIAFIEVKAMYRSAQKQAAQAAAVAEQKAAAVDAETIEAEAAVVEADNMLVEQPDEIEVNATEVQE